jgi:hypothetical protein
LKRLVGRSIKYSQKQAFHEADTASWGDPFLADVIDWRDFIEPGRFSEALRQL